MADTNPNEERPLEAWLEAFGPFGVLEALPILEALASTLVDLHAAGTVHARLGHEHVRVLEREGTCVLSLPEPWGERENPDLGFSREADLRTLGLLATRLLTGAEPQRTGGPKGPVRPLWLVDPRLPFELSALIHSLVRDEPRKLPTTASVKERLSQLLAELEGTMPEQEPASAPLQAASEHPPRRTTTTTFATADVMAKLLEKPLEVPEPPSPVPWGIPAMPVSSAPLPEGEVVQPRQGRLATRQELPSVSEGGPRSGQGAGAGRGSDPLTEPPEAPAAGEEGRASGRSGAPGSSTDAHSVGRRSRGAPALGAPRAPSAEAEHASSDLAPSRRTPLIDDDGVAATEPARVRAPEVDDAVVTAPNAVREEEDADRVPTSPGRAPAGADEDEVATTTPGHAPAVSDDDEVVATTPGHAPAVADDDEVVATTPGHAPAVADDDEVVATSPGHVPAAADDDEVVATSPGHVPAAADDDELVATSPGDVPAPAEDPERAAPAHDPGPASPGARVPSSADLPGTDHVGAPALREAEDTAGAEAAATQPSSHRPEVDEGTPTAPGVIVRRDEAERSLGPGAAPGTGEGERPARSKAPRSTRTPQGTSRPTGMMGDQATAWGPDPRRAPLRTPRPKTGDAPRSRTPPRPRGSEPDEPTRAAPRMATPPREVRTGPAKLVVGGAAAEVRPSRARLVVGGGDAEARPSRAKLIIGGGDPPDGVSAPVTTRSETQDLALEPWALPTVQVTMPEDVLGPLPGPLRRLGQQAPPPARAVPGEVALPRPSLLLRAAAALRPAARQDPREEDEVEPTRPLEPLPSPDAPWLAETVSPDERLTAAEVLRLIPIWVWIVLAAVLLGFVLIFSNTEPSESRVLPDERRMIPGLEAQARP